ncbi:pyruvate dehydrogenase (acetyl-transferring) kinase isozyme 2, mitochondrial isoform X2 [Hydra vulgaris]|uniref:Protein-serine/threonine kinase n=1 Tax=Hydra vulgaris TaxID=6087 RepID=A0ABM4CVJ7_HYDVU
MRFAKAISGDVQKYINRYSRYHQSILTIEQFTHFGKNAEPLGSYKFLRNEVPVRLAHIMQEIGHLPKNLLSMRSVDLVRSWYVQSFIDLMEFQDAPFNVDTVDRFTKTLHAIKRRHDSTVETMAQGIIELKESEGESCFLPAVQYFLDRFYMNRIGIRLLISQHLALFKENLNDNSEKFIGVFEPNCCVKTILKDAIENASFLCEQSYFVFPQVKINEVNTLSKGSEIYINYVPSHLYYILFEILKNAMRATVESHKNSDDLPSIQATIVKGNEDLTIKITDEAGGIPRSNIEKLFAYHYSTAPEPNKTTHGSPMAGYGYGLPLSRLYAKYFGGDLQIISMDGLGTSAYIYLKTLSHDAHEVIPSYNSSVAKASYENSNSVQSNTRDWSSNSFYEKTKSFAKPSQK